MIIFDKTRIAPYLSTISQNFLGNFFVNSLPLFTWMQCIHQQSNQLTKTGTWLIDFVDRIFTVYCFTFQNVAENGANDLEIELLMKVHGP
jgi:hypothetical protein